MKKLSNGNGGISMPYSVEEARLRRTLQGRKTAAKGDNGSRQILEFMHKVGVPMAMVAVGVGERKSHRGVTAVT